MKIKNKVSTIQAMSVVILLMCILYAFVGVTNSWFTESGKKINILISVANMDYSIYQGSTKLESSVGTYVDFDGEIIPDEDNILNLTLKNESLASNAYYVRYKIEFYVRGVEEDTLLENVQILNYTAPTSSKNGFFKGDDGWFYYGNTNGTEAQYQKDTNDVIIGKFVVPYSEFIDDDLNAKFNCEDIKIIINLEGSQTAFLGGEV